MCIIEHFDEIHPDGQRHPLTRLQYCENGSPTRACRDVRHLTAENVWLPLPRAPQPPILVHATEPRRRKTQRTRTEEIHGFRKFSNTLKLVLNFGNPFSKMSNKKKEYVVVERGGKKRLERQVPRRPELSPRHTPPPSPRYDDRHIVQVPEHPHPHIVQVPEHYQYQHHDPRIVQVSPQQLYDAHLVEPKHVRHSYEGSAQSTSSESPPITPVRQHRRHHSDASSEARRAEERRIDELRQERDRLKRENRNARAERDARLVAEREAAAERRRAHRRAEREQDRIEHEQHKRLESAERARLRQEREDRDRLATAARRQEERERLERNRAAGLTRRPRPGPVVHQRPREGIAARGDRVINEAIRAQNLRRFEEQNAPRPGGGWDRRRDVGDGLHRRDTLAVGQRRIYDDDRRRGGRRWV